MVSALARHQLGTGLEYALTVYCTNKQGRIESSEGVFIKPKRAQFLPNENSNSQYNTKPLGLYLELYGRYEITSTLESANTNVYQGRHENMKSS